MAKHRSRAGGMTNALYAAALRLLAKDAEDGSVPAQRALVQLDELETTRGRAAVEEALRELGIVDQVLEEEEGTPVIFRVFRGGLGDGEVIALFPTHPDTDRAYECDSYMHQGQHGTAHAHGVVSRTRAATPAEYADLAAELRGIGYKLKIVKRLTSDLHAVRHRALRRMGY